MSPTPMGTEGPSSWTCPEALFGTVGAVSQEVVEAMVRGAQANSGARYAVAVSGVAGPDGGAHSGEASGHRMAGLGRWRAAASVGVGSFPVTGPKSADRRSRQHWRGCCGCLAQENPNAG